MAPDPTPQTTAPETAIRRYLDDRGGQAEVPAYHLLMTWKLAEWRPGHVGTIADALAQAGVATDPPLAEVEDDEERVKLFVDSGESAEAPTAELGDPAQERASASLPGPGAAPVTQGRRRFGFGLGSVALILAIPIAGYALGVSSGPDLDAARTEGAEAGKSRGLAAGERAGYAQGLRAGRRAGYATAYRGAYVRSYKRGVNEIAAQGPVPAAGQPTSCPPGTVSATNGCVPEQQAVCAAYQDLVPGRGCVPPLKPGETEARPNCPPGQVPVGVTGACARP
jgi:hypothetical protein